MSRLLSKQIRQSFMISSINAIIYNTKCRVGSLITLPANLITNLRTRKSKINQIFLNNQLLFIQQYHSIKQINNMQNTQQKLNKLIEKLEANLGGQVDNQTTKKQQAKPVEQKKQEPLKQDNVATDNKQQNAAVQKKEKKEKPKKQKKEEPKKQQKNTEPTQFGPKQFAQVDMRIGEIVDCWKHPQSQNLYCEKISVCGEVREIASGLQKFVPIDQMKGKVIVMCNLKPRPLAGFNSNGMVVCQSNDDHTQVNILRPEGAVGERIMLDGFQQFFNSENILPVLNPKKKILEKALEYFKTDQEGFVVWKGIRCRTKAGFIKGVIAKGNVS